MAEPPARMPRALATVLWATLLCAACEGNGGDRRGRWVRKGDAVMRDMVRVGQLDAKELAEVSGVAPSATPGQFWVLNDSGNKSRLYAIDSAGHRLREVNVRGVKNRDWEALSRGPCPVGECLYIADVGDNLARAESVRISWLREPPVGTDAVEVEGTVEVRLADGAHDVEAIYVAADTSIWLVTKRPEANAAGAWRPSRVYRVPREAWAGGASVGVIDSVPVTPSRKSTRDWITDASLSAPDGAGARRVALLAYGAVYVLESDAATGRPGRLVARCALPIRETSAEAITWLPDGRLLVLNEGEGAAVYAGRCP